MPTASETATATFTETPTPLPTATETLTSSVTSTEAPGETLPATMTQLSETPSATATAAQIFETTEEAETTAEAPFEPAVSNPPLLSLLSADTCTETIDFDDPLENELFDVQIVEGAITTGTGVGGTDGVYDNRNQQGGLGVPSLYGSFLAVRVSIPTGTAIVSWSASVSANPGGSSQASYARYQVAGVASEYLSIGTPPAYSTYAAYGYVPSVPLSGVEWLEIHVHQNTSGTTGAVYLDGFTITYLCGSPTPTPTPTQTPTPGGPTTVYINFDGPAPAGFPYQIITGQTVAWIGQNGTTGVFAHQNEWELLGAQLYGNALQVRVSIPDGNTVVGWSAYAARNPHASGSAAVYERHEVNGVESGYGYLGAPGVYGAYTLHSQTGSIVTDWIEFHVHQNTSTQTGGVYLDTIAIQYTGSPTTPTPTPLTLADFGITLIADDPVNQPWASAEQANILTAANKVSDALALFGTLGNTNPDKFKTIMGTTLTFLRLDEVRPSNTLYGAYYDVFDAQNPSTGYCQVFDPTTVITTIAVACRGAMLQTSNWITNGLVTEYAVVHELGHVLDIRSGNQLRGFIGDTNLFLGDCNITPEFPEGERVMGVVSGGVWLRGQRGWGSTQPDSGDGQEISQFQQNPYDQTNHVEAAADMFLNWVYRRTTDAAPTNIPTNFDPISDAAPAPADACNYALQSSWEGFRNINRDGTDDGRRPGNVRYWWIEGMLNVIFLNRSWK